MGKIGLAAGFTTSVLIAAEIAKGWYVESVASAGVSIVAGLVIWRLAKLDR